jgi:hypothetical protein
MSIEKFSDEQLLFELVRRNGFHQVARKTEYFGKGWQTSRIGIGKDHSVAITMNTADLDKLVVLGIIDRETEGVEE